jgi:dTMP kinase
MAELVAAGASAEGAEAQAVAEAGGAAPAAAAAAGAAVEDGIDLSKLPEDVREAVEFAKSEKAARATAEAEKAAADAQAAAEAEYMEWYGKTVEANADLKGDKARANALHAYVAAADDMEGGLAAFRADFPAPAAAEAPVTLGGGGATGGIEPSRPSGGSFSDLMGDVWDKMAGTAPR